MVENWCRKYNSNL